MQVFEMGEKKESKEDKKEEGECVGRVVPGQSKKQTILSNSSLSFWVILGGLQVL